MRPCMHGCFKAYVCRSDCLYARTTRKWSFRPTLDCTVRYFWKSPTLPSCYSCTRRVASCPDADRPGQTSNNCGASGLPPAHAYPQMYACTKPNCPPVRGGDPAKDALLETQVRTSEARSRSVSVCPLLAHIGPRTAQIGACRCVAQALKHDGNRNATGTAVRRSRYSEGARERAMPEPQPHETT